MVDIFGVIADSTRRELLQVLLERYSAADTTTGDISVGELVERLGLSQPTVSKHLKVLRDAGLVVVRELGQHRYYRLESAPLETVEDWLLPFISAATDVTAGTPDALRRATSGWSASLPSALPRRTGEGQHAGAAVGRAVADATHGVRHRLEEASENVERLIDPIKKKLKKD